MAFSKVGDIQLNPLSNAVQRDPGVASAVDLPKTKWLFSALCFYVVAQGYMIPILPIGPWAVWFRIADFALIWLVLAFVIARKYVLRPSKANQAVFFVLICFLGLGVLSYIWYLALLKDSGAAGINFGAFQIFTMFKFVAIFWITAHIPLPPTRIAILRQIISGVLVFVCLSILLTYLNIVRLPEIAPHLPRSAGVAGPWADFGIAEWKWERRGWGTIGYNHAYVAAQILMLLALRLHLSGEKISLSDSVLVLITLFAGFLSGSRAGLAAIAIFAIIFWIKRPFYMIAMIVLGLVISPLALLVQPDSSPVLSELNDSLERQSTLLEATNTSNLSGRDQIWKQRLEFLDEKPGRWLFGSGFGAAIDSGDNAHNVYLQVVVELGLVGLFVFAIFFLLILSHLYRRETKQKMIFWVTIALLLSSLTQDTFYPDVALGHFFGFYLCSVAIALRDPVTVTANNHSPNLGI